MAYRSWLRWDHIWNALDSLSKDIYNKLIPIHPTNCFYWLRQQSLQVGQLMNLHLAYQNNKDYTLLEKLKLLYIF